MSHAHSFSKPGVTAIELFDELVGKGFTVEAAAQRSIIGPDASTSRSSSAASTISWSP